MKNQPRTQALLPTPGDDHQRHNVVKLNLVFGVGLDKYLPGNASQSDTCCFNLNLIHTDNYVRTMYQNSLIGNPKCSLQKNTIDDEC